MRHGLSLLLPLLVASLLLADDRKAKPQQQNAQDRVTRLLDVLKTDKKESHRTDAAEQLARFPAAEHPEIIPALMNILTQDNSTSVRKAAVKSLASFEPPTHEIKQALDQVVSNDESWTVRQVARLARLRYKPKDEPPVTPEQRKQVSAKPDPTGAMKKDKAKPQGQTNGSQPLPLPPPSNQQKDNDPLKGSSGSKKQEDVLPPLPLPPPSK